VAVNKPSQPKTRRQPQGIGVPPTHPPTAVAAITPANLPPQLNPRRQRAPSPLLSLANPQTLQTFSTPSSMTPPSLIPHPAARNQCAQPQHSPHVPPASSPAAGNPSPPSLQPPPSPPPSRSQSPGTHLQPCYPALTPPRLTCPHAHSTLQCGTHSLYATT
jgi:hypothetical protein